MAGRDGDVERAVATLRERVRLDDEYVRWDIANEGKVRGQYPGVNPDGVRRGHFHHASHGGRSGYLHRVYRLQQEPWPPRYESIGWEAHFGAADFEIPLKGAPMIRVRTSLYPGDSVRAGAGDYEPGSALTLREAANREVLRWVVERRYVSPHDRGRGSYLYECKDAEEMFDVAPALSWLATVIADYLAAG